MGNTNIKMETFVSAVLVLDSVNINDFKSYLEELQDYLDQLYSDYEIVIIDQNNTNISSILQKELLEAIPSIRWIKLAFPVEMDVALSAGIENAIGDYVVLLRPTVDPIEIIEGMIKGNSNGYDVIIGIARRPRTLGYRIVRKLGNKILHSINYHIPKNATPVRSLSRRAINMILCVGQINHQFFVRVSNTGYLTKNYEYELLKSNRLKKTNLFSGIKQTAKLMIFNSTKPLRWMSIVGLVGSFSAFMFTLYSIVINLIKNNVIEGWTSIVFFSSFLFMILFIILAFLGEYMARLLNETGKQKSYYISSEETSTVMLETDRFNVLHQS